MDFFRKVISLEKKSFFRCLEKSRGRCNWNLRGDFFFISFFISSRRDWNFEYVILSMLRICIFTAINNLFAHELLDFTIKT